MCTLEAIIKSGEEFTAPFEVNVRLTKRHVESPGKYMERYSSIERESVKEYEYE